MRKLLIISLLHVTFLLSCKKTILHDVHFHGIVTFSCDSSPANQIQLQVIRKYYKNGSNNDIIGIVTTKSDGSYDLNTEIDDVGSFEGYFLQFASGSPQRKITSDLLDASIGNSKDVVLNAKISVTNPFRFHIKNFTPYDNNDLFNTLLFHPDGFTPDVYDTIISSVMGNSLHGTTVDLLFDTLALHNYNDNNTSIFCFKFTFTKNNIYHEIFDTAWASCFDTTYVDIFY